MIDTQTKLDPGCFYHIYNHANGGDNLFRFEENYYFFIRKWKKYIHPIADSVAFCLMPNHFHWLIKVKEAEEILTTFPKISQKITTSENDNVNSNIDLNGETLEKLSKFLSKQFSNLFSSYTQSFNKVYKRRGSLFLKNFKRKKVDSADYLRQLIIYIHTNPVHHSFTNKPEDWDFSSYNEISVGKSSMFNYSVIPEIFEDKEEFITAHRSKAMNLLNDDYKLE